MIDNILEILIPILSLQAWEFFAAVLAWANVKFKVEKDPRIDEILAALPGATGACGHAGCAACRAVRGCAGKWLSRGRKK